MASPEPPALAPLTTQQGGGLLASVRGTGARSMPGKFLGKSPPLATLGASGVTTSGVAATDKLTRGLLKRSMLLGSEAEAVSVNTESQATISIAGGKSSVGGKSPPRKLRSMTSLLSNEAPLTLQTAVGKTEAHTLAVGPQSPRASKPRRKMNRRPSEASATTVEASGVFVKVTQEQPKALDDQPSDPSSADSAVADAGNDTGVSQHVEDEPKPETAALADTTPNASAPCAESDNDSDAFDFDDIDSQDEEDHQHVEAANVDGVPVDSPPGEEANLPVSEAQNGQKEEVRAEEEEGRGCPPTDDTQPRRDTIDLDELYDCSSSLTEEDIRSRRLQYVRQFGSARRPRVTFNLCPMSLIVCYQADCFLVVYGWCLTGSTRLQPKVFLPRASDIELFHAVLAHDIGFLQEMLERLSPESVLGFVDTSGRCLYHYAALSRSKRVQDVVFHHVSSYRDQRMEIQVQQLMRSKNNMHTWVERNRSSNRGWIPPRVKELQQEATRRKCGDWKLICASLDDNGRSFFHYIATTSLQIPVDDIYECCSAIRSKPSLLATRDICEKTALHYAVEADNIHQVKWFFRMGICLKQRDIDLLLSLNTSRAMENVLLQQLETIDTRNYYTPAFLRDSHEEGHDPDCGSGVSSFVLAKLQRAVDESAGRLHQSPLHRAAMYGNARAVELLLERGADPNARDSNGWTALHYCADEATAMHLAIAELLQEAATSVEINAKSVKGRTPLHVAVHSCKHQVLSWDGKCQQPGHAEADNRIAFVKFLHSCNADLNARDTCGATPLLHACRGDHVGVTKFLLVAGCGETAVGENNWNALHLAAIRGNPAMVALLVSWDADSRVWSGSVDQHGRKPADVAKSDDTRRALTNIWSACYSGNVDQVKCLLKRSKKENARRGKPRGSSPVSLKTIQTERTALHFVAQGYFDLLQPSQSTRQLSISSHQEKMNRERLAKSKRTASSRFSQIAVVLLHAGADACVGDKWGVTPLMIAASIEDAAFMDVFLERIADEEDLQAADVEGNTALHYSYAFCQAKISTMLEDEVSDSEMTNQQGSTPLEMTAYRSKIFPDGLRQCLNRHQALQQTLVFSQHAKGAM